MFYFSSRNLLEYVMLNVLARIYIFYAILLGLATGVRLSFNFVNVLTNLVNDY